MDVVSLCPLPAASLVWKPAKGHWSLTIVCKATYELLPGECRLAPRQEPTATSDVYWDEDESRGLLCPADLVPMKPRADVLLVGYAFAPRGEPVRSLVARLAISELNKRVEVVGDRAWTAAGQLVDAEPFTKMPLRYERAAGGPGTSNPVGMQTNAAPNAEGLIPIPNLQLPGERPSLRRKPIEPVGFGPIAPTWPTRTGKLNDRLVSWSPDALRQQPVSDIDPAFWNAAPPDQQMTFLSGRERITLEHLHAEHARLVTSLPGDHPRAFMRQGAARQEIGLQCDTLWIDTSRALCTLTWRGHVRLNHPEQTGRIIVVLEQGGESISNDDIDRMLGISEEATGVRALRSRIQESSPGNSQRATSEGDEKERRKDIAQGAVVGLVTETLNSTFQPKEALPFKPGIPQTPPPLPGKEIESVPQARAIPPAFGETRLVLGGDPGAPPVLPFAGSPATVLPASSPAVSALPAHSSSVQTRVAAPPNNAAIHAPVADRIQEPSHVRAFRGGPEPSWVFNLEELRRAPDTLLGGPLDLPSRAGPPPEAPGTAGPLPSRGAHPTARDVLQLLWIEPESMGRIYGYPRFQGASGSVEVRPYRTTIQGADVASSEDIPANGQRRIAAILAQGEPTPGQALNDVLIQSVDETGVLAPPLVLLAGQLQFPFDEIETLKAVITAVAPYGAADERLKEATFAAHEVLKLPWLRGAGSIAEGLTARLREAFAHAHRVVLADVIDAPVERMLLEARHYQTRTIFGQRCIRSLLHVAGLPNPIPAYLPEHLTTCLPMVTRMRARLIAEVHLLQDPREPHPNALRVVALGRVGALYR